MRKLGRLILPGIIVAYLLLVSSMLTSEHEWGDDFSGYLMQAISIVKGRIPEFIQDNTFTIQHSTLVQGPVAYPWGFPLMIAPLYALFGLNLAAIKLLNVLVYPLFLIVLYFLFQDRLSKTERGLIVALFAFSPAMLSFHDNILSDLPFLLFSSLAVLLIERAYPAGHSLRIGWGQSVVIGLAIFAAIFVRTGGVVLLVTLLFAQWEAGRAASARRQAPGVTCQAPGVRCQVPGVTCQVPDTKCQVSGATCQVPGATCQVPGATCQVPGATCQVPGGAVEASDENGTLQPPAPFRIPSKAQMGERWRWVLPYLIVGGLWGVVSIWLPSGGSGYVEQAGAISARTILDNLAANALLPGTFWGMQAVFSPLNILVMVISGPVALYGAWQNAVKRASGGKDRLFFLYTGLTLGLYTIVPFFQGLRFLFPALPFYVYFFFKGISALTARFLSPARARGLSTAVLTGLALVLLVQSIGLATRSRQNLIRVEGPFDRLSKQMFRAINNDTAPDSVIIFFKPRVLHLLTGREAFFSMDCADLQIANYLIEHKDQPLMQLARCSQAFDLEPVFENARFVIYRVSSR